VEGEPSQTALVTAAARAAHLIVDRPPWIFEDTLAEALVGDAGSDLIALHRQDPTAPRLASLRVAMCTRSRYTEHRVAAAVNRGVRQYVILGAGLDSFAYRAEAPGDVCVFEVDHPASQAWKQQRLDAAAVPIPSSVRFVPVDFTVDSLAEQLSEQGFDRSRPVIVSCLGVTQYVSVEAIASTLLALGSLGPPVELVMTYASDALRDQNTNQPWAEFFTPRAAVGEPWTTFFTPEDIARLVEQAGMTIIEDVAYAAKDSIESSLWQRSDALVPHERPRLVWASTAA
jgi:methyltransferase (TIGR00027 family)